MDCPPANTGKCLHEKYEIAARGARSTGCCLLSASGLRLSHDSNKNRTNATEATLPRGTKDTVAVTVRLDEARYHKLVGYGARFTPRRTNQEILVAALDAYLSAEE